MLRVCSICREEKELTSENFAKKGKGFQWTCKPCHAQYRKEHYSRNAEKYKTLSANRRKDLTKWLNEYKHRAGCKICGERHIACLDLHHRDPNEKEIVPSKMLEQGWSQERMQTEIDKCDVLCSNCHRKLHWEERNSALLV